MNAISVHEADKIIREWARGYGEEEVHFEAALGRVLAEDLRADRDLPPFDRATKDGIAVRFGAYESGTREFHIEGEQVPGREPVEVEGENGCVEIMTGAALGTSVDTVIPYEEVEIEDGVAKIKSEDARNGQNVHPRGADKKAGETVVEKGQLVGSTVVNVAASLGKTTLKVQKLPRVVVITTGDEMVGPEEEPSTQQLRRSNGVTIKSVLSYFGLSVDMLHLNDDYEHMKNEVGRCLDEYDVILTSGGVSAGKYDYLPKVFEDLGVRKLFYKVKQRPGKPFWFGRHPNKTVVFGFPGNPVSTYLCLNRYFIPWLRLGLGLEYRAIEYAALSETMTFEPALQRFVQVELVTDTKGVLRAIPMAGNGSGDFTTLAKTDAFLELPMEKKKFKKGKVFRVTRYAGFASVSDFRPDPQGLRVKFL